MLHTQIEKLKQLDATHIARIRKACHCGTKAEANGYCLHCNAEDSLCDEKLTINVRNSFVHPKTQHTCVICATSYCGESGYCPVCKTIV